MTQSLKRVARATEKLSAARSAHEDAIRAAAADGASNREIADAAGVSREQVRRIVKAAA